MNEQDRLAMEQDQHLDLAEPKPDPRCTSCMKTPIKGACDCTHVEESESRLLGTLDCADCGGRHKVSSVSGLLATADVCPAVVYGGNS